jgi:flagellar basal body rod protein FlgF
MEDSNFRQVARLTSLLTRMKRHERQMEAFEEVDEKCPRGL